MKIIKDIMISGSVDTVFLRVSEDPSISSISKPQNAAGAAELLESIPQMRVSYHCTSPDFPLDTTLEFLERGRRTKLQVTVTGWDKVKPELARLEMPRMSLEWEKLLGKIKRELESVSV